MRKMSEASASKIKERIDYFNQHGLEAVCNKYGIVSESFHRSKRLYYEHVGKESTENISRIPKVLLFDIETTPIVCFTWGLFKQNIQHDNIITDQHMISWAGKWLNTKDVFGDVISSEEILAHDDSRITDSLWKALDEADIIIAHNLKKYDRKVANTRFILNGLKPPSPYQQIDTLEISRKEFRFTSNRLDYLGKLVSNKGKIDTNMELWRKCFYGDTESLSYMYMYNKEDVVLLEEVYYELRPYMHSHPNLALYAETHEETCPHCLSTDLKECGDYATPAGKFDALRCGGCGAILRRRKSLLSKAQRENLLISNAR